MNKEKLIKYIKSPELLNQESLDDINKLIIEFPYFQTAKLLLLKNLYNINSTTAENELKQAAVHITNRKKIYLLLQEKAENKITKEIKKDLAPESEPKKEVTVSKKEGEENSDSETKKEELSDIVSKRLHEIKKPTDESDSTPKQTDSDEKIQPSKNFEHIADTILKKAAEQKNIKNQQKKYNQLTKDPSKHKPISEEEKKLSIEYSQNLLIIDENEKIVKNAKEEPSINLSSNQNNLKKESKNLLLLEYPEEESTAHYDKNMNTLFSERVNILDLKLPFEVPFIFEDDIEDNDLIENFLKNSPVIERKVVSKEKDTNDISIESIKDNEEYLTDTLANIYIKQGYYSKAISAYKKLSLKYPEKSSYFAQQIEKIKDLINKT